MPNVKIHFGVQDISRKYRIKQNNDYPANKPSFHTVFQDAAQSLHKRLSTRVASAQLAYVARITFSVSFLLPASKSAKKLLEVRNRMSILYVVYLGNALKSSWGKPLDGKATELWKMTTLVQIAG